MKFRKDHLELLTKAIAEAITEKEDEVFPYIGGDHVLDQTALYETIEHALNEA